MRGYQKGTVHIVFNRSDLVEKLNDIIARHYRCIAATSLIKQKSHGIYAGAFSVIIIISEHDVTLSHQLLFISMPSFLPESVFLGAVLEEERRDGFRFCFPNNVTKCLLSYFIPCIFERVTNICQCITLCPYQDNNVITNGIKKITQCFPLSGEIWQFR